jgi:glycosyltransferase involved in cell wall biosynthesis
VAWRILFSYENLLPTTQADAEVFLTTAGALAARGHEAIVATPRPPDANENFEREVLDFYGIDAPLQISPVPSFTKNIALQHVYHALRLPEHPAFPRADFIYARNPIVVMRSLQAGQRVLMDHYRPWGDQFPALRPVFRRFMNHPRFLGLVVHSAYSCQSYRRLGIPKAKLRVIHNGFDPRRMQPMLSKEEARAKIDLPQDKKVVTYAGRVDSKKGLDVLLHLAERMPEAMFVIVGSEGPSAIETRARVLANLKIVPWQAGSALAPYLYAADVLTIPPSTEPLKKAGNVVLPLKTFLYLSAGRPIFAGANPDTAEVFENDRNACLVESGNLSEAERQLKRLLNDPDRMERLGKACREQSQELTWASRAAKIDRFIEECLARDPATVHAEPWSPSEWCRDTATWLASGLLTGNWIHR